MNDQKAINAKIAEGYDLYYGNEACKACDIWLDAWEGLKLLMEESGVKGVWELNDQFEWAEPPSNCVQELEQELHNAGLKDSAYHEKRIAYCRELLGYVGYDELMESNTRRAIADSYFYLGDSAECDRLYGQWLEEDPQWGWGYLGWFMCYDGDWDGRQDIAKASGIIDRALGAAAVRDRLDVVDKALLFYEKHGGDAAKLFVLREEFSALKALSPSYDTEHKPITMREFAVGRNDPCPCGSGKKYKKCHGRD